MQFFYAITILDFLAADGNFSQLIVIKKNIKKQKNIINNVLDFIYVYSSL